jgi:hypothetical protein
MRYPIIRTLSCIAICLPWSIMAQINSTTYYMQNLPQSALLNPAIQPGCNFYLSLPSVSFEIQNSAISLSDLIVKNPDGPNYSPFDSLASDADENKFLDNFSSINTLSGEFNFNAFNIGFRANDSYFSFHMALRMNSNFDYPDDMMRFFIKGNTEEPQYDLSGFGGKFTVFKEYGLSYSRKLNNYWTLGARGKILFGVGDVNISDQKVLLDMDTFNIDVSSKFKVNASIPGAEYWVNEDGTLDSMSFSGTQDMDPVELALSNKNMGVGIDLGAIYSYTDKLSFSASVLDLGFIRWTNDVANLNNDSEFTFTGIEFEGIGSSDNESEDDTTFIDMIIDSLRNSFVTETTYSPYSSMLTAKVLIGANYKLLEKVDVGFLSYTQIYRGKLFPRITLSANLRPMKWLNTSFSYSLLNQEYYNLGFGLSFKPGPFNLYFIGDTYPIAYTRSGNIPVPIFSKGFRFQFGFNFVFGCNKDKKADRDIPLVE